MATGCYHGPEASVKKSVKALAKAGEYWSDHRPIKSGMRHIRPRNRPGRLIRHHGPRSGAGLEAVRYGRDVRRRRVEAIPTDLLRSGRHARGQPRDALLGED